MVFPSTPQSPKPPSPPSPTKKPALSISNVTNIFNQMRRTKEQAKAHHIVSSSGDPQTHASVAEGSTSQKQITVEHSDVFTCIGAVNPTMLLRATRGALMETAELAGANVLIDEQCVSSEGLKVPLLKILPSAGGNVQYVVQNTVRMGLSKSRRVFLLCVVKYLTLGQHLTIDTLYGQSNTLRQTRSSQTSRFGSSQRHPWTDDHPLKERLNIPGPYSYHSQ